MVLKFVKMHGCGNDYVYVNGFDYNFSKEKKSQLAKMISDRHFGVGSDGLIFINPSKQADFEMEMYNADGSRSEMCGNGMRCVAKYVYDYKLTDKTEFEVESMGRNRGIKLFLENDKVKLVTVDMGEPILSSKEIPVLSDKENFISEPVSVLGEEFKVTCVSMGNPHAVLFHNPDDVLHLGPDFEVHPLFPKRINTEFVEIIDKNNVRMRVYERGTGETLACGTGCSATCVACVLNGKTERDIIVHVLGGDIQVRWDEFNNHIYMTGPGQVVFEGEIEIGD